MSQNTIMLGTYVFTKPFDILKKLNGYINKSYPNAKDLMNISLTSPRDIKSNSEYIVKYNDEIGKLKKQLGIPSSDVNRMLVYSEKSKLSKSLSHSQKIRKAVMDWKNGKIKNSDGSKKSKFVVAANDTEDMKRAINGCTITGLKENPDGSISGYVYDVYDFNLKYTDMQNVGKNLSFANKVAYYLQKSGLINNYQILVPIKIKTDLKG